MGGIVGILLGGSRARSEHTPESDYDLGLYYRPPLDVDALPALARSLGDPAANVTRPGEWGPWVDGGGWLHLSGSAVDWIYRDLDRVRASCEDAQAGRYILHFQVGHPFGVPDFSYAGELALGLVLADPSGDITALKEEFHGYPPRLGRPWWPDCGKRRSISTSPARRSAGRTRRYVAGCLFRVVELCAHALHGHAGRWLVNEKGAVASAGRLPGAPVGFPERAHGVLAHLGSTPSELNSAIDAARDLVADTTTACGSPG